MNTNFDVIVSGAGIAGLLIASELSIHKKILIIDSKEDLQTTKYWVTLKSCIDNNKDFQHLVDSYYTHMDFIDAYQNSFRLNGEYVLWNTVELMNFLKRKILKNNGEVKFGQRFYGYKTKNDSIEIFANGYCYTAKVLIDCMGYNSPLILAKNMIDIKGYYLLYGARLKLKENIHPICLSNVILDRKPKYFELFPKSNEEAFATIIYPTYKLTDSKGLAGDFKFITSKSHYSKYFEENQILSRLWGIVPVGNIQRKALDRIFFFGESAQSNPAASGTCLTRILLNYKKVSVFLNEQIESDNLTEKSLSNSPEVLNPFIRRLQLYAFKDILTWNSDLFSKFIRIINHVDHEIINRFLFGELTSDDVFTRTRILSLFNRKNLFLAKALIQSLR